MSKLLPATRASGSGGLGPGANEAGFSMAVAGTFNGCLGAACSIYRIAWLV